MLKKRIIFLITVLVSFCSLNQINAQKVTISPDVLIRDESTFNLLGKVNDNILLFRNKTYLQELNIYNEGPEFIQSIPLDLGDKRKNIIGAATSKNDINVFYSYRNRLNEYIQCVKFSGKGSKLIVDTVYHKENAIVSSFYKFESSENNRFSVVFRPTSGGMFFVTLYDVQEMKTLWSNEIDIEGVDLNRDFRKIVVTNQGEVTILYEKFNYRYRINEHHFRKIEIDRQGNVEQFKLPLTNLFSIDVQLVVDNINQTVRIIGLYGDDMDYISNGYFVYQGNELIINPYVPKNDQTMINKGFNIRDGLEDYKLTDVILREDGGFLLALEFNREYFRSTARNNNFSSAYRPGSVDYFAEDIFIINVLPTGETAWRTVLPKKQISQDDNGIYSSYFLFKTPTKLHFVFNDEIKSNNTVSEYVLNPLGVFERNAVLSTAYQNLKLKIKSAVQTSANSFVLISERGNKLNLVKVEYDE